MTSRTRTLNWNFLGFVRSPSGSTENFQKNFGKKQTKLESSTRSNSLERLRWKTVESLLPENN